MCMGGGDGGAASAARHAEEARQARIQQGTQQINEQFAGFNDGFYDQRKQAYLDYANPQFERQFQDAEGKLVSQLARAGLLNSSVAAQRLNRLRQERDQARDSILSQAMQVANDARRDVESQRSGLIQTLTATADPSASAASAANAAQLLASRPQFSPLGQIFADSTALLATDQIAKNQGFRGLFPTRNPGTAGSSTIIRN